MHIPTSMHILVKYSYTNARLSPMQIKSTHHEDLTYFNYCFHEEGQFEVLIK